MKKSFVNFLMFVLVLFPLMFTGCTNKSEEIKFDKNLETYTIDEEKNEEISDIDEMLTDAIDTDKSDKYIIDEEKNEEISSIDEIFIDICCGDINVIVEDREDVKVHLYGDITCNFEPRLIVNIQNDTLEITLGQKMNNRNIRKSNLKLDLYIPITYSENLKIDNTCGDICIENLNLNKLCIDVTTSDTNIQNLVIKDFDYDAVSGNLNGEKIFTEKVDFDTTSGNIKLDELKGDIEGRSTCGDIILNYKEFNNNIDIKTTTGDITINIPDNAEFYMDAEVITGNIGCDFPIKIESADKGRKLKGIVESNENTIKIEGVTADVDINMIKTTTNND